MEQLPSERLTVGPTMTVYTSAASANGLTDFGVLSLLLTTASLLFAALTLSASLSAGSSLAFGARTSVPPAALAFTAAGVLSTVAAAAVLAWTDLFLGSDWPSGWNGRLEAVALLVAIVAQPSIALLIAVGIWRPR